jgi:hypothetical protein
LAGIFIAAVTLLAMTFATAGPAAGAKPCWRQVLDDWTDNTRLNKTYPIRCYDEALENLPEDIVSYTDAYDQISDARQAALRGGGLDRETQGNEPGAGDPDDDDGGPLDTLFGIGSDSSDSIPLPLLILGILAALLMAAGAAGLLARKLQARRAEGGGGPGPRE